MAIAMGAWFTDVAFLIYGKFTPSPLHFLKVEENSCARHICLGITQVSITRVFGACLTTHCLQLRATWVSTQSACVVPNTENSKITVIATLVSDVVLLLTMLAGLLRLRQYSSNMSGLCQHLWRQVGSAASRSLTPTCYAFPT